MTNIEIGITTEFDISEVAYELYKQDWIENNTSKEMRMDALRVYYEYRQECIEMDTEIDSFEEWISEVGYGQGSLYVCYEEFCDMEYHDKEYMCELLKLEDLINLYYADINDDNEP